jgi:hypothetical protein
VEFEVVLDESPHQSLLFFTISFYEVPMIVSLYVHESGQFLKSFASSSKMYNLKIQPELTRTEGTKTCYGFCEICSVVGTAVVLSSAQPLPPARSSTWSRISRASSKIASPKVSTAALD